MYILHFCYKFGYDHFSIVYTFNNYDPNIPIILIKSLISLCAMRIVINNSLQYNSHTGKKPIISYLLY